MFFRRYGLQDGATVVINSVLLFVALFYVYPLKFMFDSLFARIMDSPDLRQMSLFQLSRASAIYGLGFVVLFVMFTLLYVHAYRKRHALGLTPLEILDVRIFAGHHLVSASVGLTVVAIALLAPVRMSPIAPAAFALMAPAHWLFGRLMDGRRESLHKKHGAGAPAG